jgi:dinuclear metal center YbgI/SA1388 family protein
MYLFLLFRLIALPMPTRISEIISCLNEHAPFSLAESWDNVGLLVGDPTRTVTSILIGLDPTCTLAEEAISAGADAIITHHPLIFKPLPAIDTASPSGRFIEMTISHRISVIACHTNLDSADGGVSDILAKAVGLDHVEPLLPSSTSANPAHGMGRIGRFAKAKPAAEFLRDIGAAVGLPAFFIAGRLPAAISTVAVCGGSGSELASIARERGADVFVTAEIKHNVARWAEEQGFCLIEGTHYGTERHAVTLLTELLRRESLSRNWGVAVSPTTTEHHPFVLTHID